MTFHLGSVRPLKSMLNGRAKGGRQGRQPISRTLTRKYDSKAAELAAQRALKKTAFDGTHGFHAFHPKPWTTMLICGIGRLKQSYLAAQSALKKETTMMRGTECAKNGAFTETNGLHVLRPQALDHQVGLGHKPFKKSLYLQ